jgi:hypothetical protein
VAWCYLGFLGAPILVEGEGDETLPWLPHAAEMYWGGGATIPTVVAVLHTMVASATKAFRSLALAARRGLVWLEKWRDWAARWQRKGVMWRWFGGK